LEWYLAIVSLVWAFQFALIVIFTIVGFRLAAFRQVWLVSSGLVPSYFSINICVALCLGYLAAREVAAGIADPRNRDQLLFGVALLIFISGFGLPLGYLGTHQLNSSWYELVILEEPVDRGRELLGVVEEVSADGASRVLLESCEEVRLELEAPPSNQFLIVAVERYGRFTGSSHYGVVGFLEQNDLCTFLNGYGGFARCPTSRCS